MVIILDLTNMSEKISTIVGIDPGMSGGVTVIQGDVISIFDVPLQQGVKSNKHKKVYNVQAMAEILRPFKGQKTLICIESVHAMKSQGVTSMFNFGRGLGLWEGITAGLNCKVEFFTPQTWKKQWATELLMVSDPKPDILKMTPQELKKAGKVKQAEFIEAKKEYSKKKAKQKEAAKDAARALAARLYPNLAEKFELKKHDGRAESLLIAEYKRLEIQNG